MPRFDYTCDNCNFTLSDTIVNNIDEKVICNKCNCIMRRHFPENTSFSLKGNGWAKDLYSTNGENK